MKTKLIAVGYLCLSWLSGCLAASLIITYKPFSHFWVVPTVIFSLLLSVGFLGVFVIRLTEGANHD